MTTALVDLHLDCGVCPLKPQCFTRFPRYFRSGKKGHICASDIRQVGPIMADNHVPPLVPGAWECYVIGQFDTGTELDGREASV